jgi:hypothetical protein
LAGQHSLWQLATRLLQAMVLLLVLALAGLNSSPQTTLLWLEAFPSWAGDCSS